MSVLIFCIVWYGLGLLGAHLWNYTEKEIEEKETKEYIPFMLGFVFSVGGILMLIVGVFNFIGTLMKYKKNNIYNQPFFLWGNKKEEK